ncbi:MAG: hypothetical protein ABI823_08415 [Bryobacteraceae bacterium]
MLVTKSILVTTDQLSTAAGSFAEREQMSFRLSLLRLTGQPSERLEVLAEILDPAS